MVLFIDLLVEYGKKLIRPLLMLFYCTSMIVGTIVVISVKHFYLNMPFTVKQKDVPRYLE